jgi:hypothetical protein
MQVFLVNNKWVVKFYPEWHDMANWGTEAALHKYLHLQHHHHCHPEATTTTTATTTATAAADRASQSQSQSPSLVADFTPRLLAKGVLYDPKHRDSGSESMDRALEAASRNDERRAGYFTHPQLGRCWRWPYVVTTSFDSGPGSLVKCAGAVHPQRTLEEEFVLASRLRDEENDNALLMSLKVGQYHPSMAELAHFLGQYLSELHTMHLRRPLPNVVAMRHTPAEARQSDAWTSFDHFMLRQRQKAHWTQKNSGRLTKAQLADLESYLPRDTRQLVASHVRNAPTGPSLLHGDLNEDHLLVCPDVDDDKQVHTEVAETGVTIVTASKWRPVGVIDYGDSQCGDPHYDLVALHISLFKCDTKLLRIFLKSYCSSSYYSSSDAAATTTPSSTLWYPHDLPRFRHTAMCYTLLHRQDALRSVFLYHKDWINRSTLKELEFLVWGWDDSE